MGKVTILFRTLKRATKNLVALFNLQSELIPFEHVVANIDIDHRQEYRQNHHR